MDWLLTIIVGAVIGWLASIVMKTNAQMGALLNIIVGVVGAALGRWLFGNVLGLGGAQAAGALSVGGVLWGVLGAVILIAILKAFHVLGGPIRQ